MASHKEGGFNTPSPEPSIGASQEHIFGNGIGVAHFQLYSERSDKRRLEEEVYRLQLQLSESQATCSSLNNALTASRLECDTMEQLFLDQRRRNADLEIFQKRCQLLSSETNSLQTQLDEVSARLKKKDRELFEFQLMSHTEFIPGAGGNELQLQEADRRLLIMSDYFASLVNLVIKSRPLSIVGAHRGNIDVTQSVSELRYLLSRSEERAADTLSSLQKERQTNSLLRKELNEAESKINSLLVIDPAPLSNSTATHASSTLLYTPVNMNLLSPNAARSIREDEKLSSKVQQTLDENDALRKQITVLEIKLSEEMSKSGSVPELKEHLRKTEATLHSTLQTCQQLAEQLDACRLEVLSYKNQLQRQSPIADSAVVSLGAQLRECAEQLEEERNLTSSLRARLKLVESAPNTSTSLQAAHRKLELVISEMSDIKAENVSLRAQAASKGLRLEASEPRNVSPKRASFETSDTKFTPTSNTFAHQQHVFSPWNEADNKLLMEIKELSHRNAHLEAALTRQKEAATRTTTLLATSLDNKSQRKEAQPASKLTEPSKVLSEQSIPIATKISSPPKSRSLIISPNTFDHRRDLMTKAAPVLNSDSPPRHHKHSWASDCPVSTPSVKRRRMPGEVASHPSNYESKAQQ